MRKLAPAAVLVLVLSACLGNDFGDSIDGSWQLDSGIWAGQVVPILADHPITLTIDGDHLSGTAACNGYGGTVVIDGSSITIGELAITEMGCFPAEVMEAEATYMAALPAIDTVAIDNGVKLVLSGEDAELVFSTLEPVPADG